MRRFRHVKPRDDAMLRYDTAAFRGINALAGRWPIVDAVGVFCARYLILVMVGVVVLKAVLVLRQSGTRLYAAQMWSEVGHIVLAGAFAFIGNWLFSLWWFRERPFVALKNVHLIVPAPLTSHAFPSGHSSVAFAIAFSVLLVDLPFGLALLVAATAVAIGRVFVGVHYPLDVVAGVFVGLFWALAIHGVARHYHDVEFVRKLLPRRR